MDKLVIDFKKIVENNVFKRITLEEISFLSNMSLSTFKRKFIETYGTPPHKWFQQKRMQHAYQLIVNNKAKPGEIYFDFGYESLSSFSVAFKQMYGMPPSKLSGVK